MDEPFLPEWFWDEPPEVAQPKAEPPDVVEHVRTIDYTYGGGWMGAPPRPSTMFVTPALWQDLKNMMAQYQGNLKSLANSLMGGFTRGELVYLDSILPSTELSGFQVHDEVQVTAGKSKSKSIHQMPAPLTDQELKLRIVKGRSSPKTISLPKVTPTTLPGLVNLDPTDKFVDALVAELKASLPKDST